MLLSLMLSRQMVLVERIRRTDQRMPQGRLASDNGYVRKPRPQAKKSARKRRQQG
jgi:hypothetical protein